MFELEKAEKRVGVIFQDKDLLVRAFTHRSYINENKKRHLHHNERMEFLGDAVLELVITDFLYNEFPDKSEGELTLYRAALVNTDTLAEVANDLMLNDFILLSRGESKDKGRARHSIMADTVEAVIGAMYLDQGYEVPRKFIIDIIAPRLGGIMARQSWIDAKSLFQERAQDHFGVTPLYETLSEDGPDHDKQFEVGVYVEEKCIGKGVGKSKQEAAQVAAQNALVELGWKEAETIETPDIDKE